MTSQTKPVSKQLKLTFDQINACANWPNVLNYIRNFDFSDTPELELDQDKILLNIKYLLLQRFYNISDQELLNLITDRISFQYFLDFQEECFLDEDPQYIKFRQVLASNNVLEKVMDIISHNLSKHGLCISQGTISDIKLEPVSSHTQRPDLSKPKIASSGNRSGITLEDIKLMIQGQSSQSFKHYALQMQLHQAQKDVRNGNISIETAAQSLFELCQKVLRGNGKTAAKAQPSSSGTKINLETLKQMILGEKKLQFKHYALQMQLHQAQKDVRNGTVSLDIAAKNLFELCKRILAGKSRATSSPQSSEGSKISLETIKEMIQGQSSQSFKHYALQMQLHQAQKDVRNGDTSLERAWSGTDPSR